LLQVSNITLKILQYIQQQLATIINSLKSAIKQKATKAYLTNITIIKLLILESKVELCNNL